MPLNSRAKGHRGETEVLNLLQPCVNAVCDDCGQPRVVLRKNRDQRYMKKQYDIIGLPWFAVEVKYREAGSVGAWWKQVKESTLPGQTPVLFYRKNREPWSVRTRVRVDAGGGKMVKITCTMDLASFLVLLRERLRLEIRSSKTPREASRDRKSPGA